ncbi:hypothetical protein Leryth_026860 [Lithospermum erythrorhizon]|nr:hypothetical protein Leryth_026860 [Lithospermum erythrorhizon]
MEILMVFLIFHKLMTIVDHVEVFKLQVPKLRWVKMEEVGDRALFVEPESIWVKAIQYGCKTLEVSFPSAMALIEASPPASWYSTDHNVWSTPVAYPRYVVSVALLLYCLLADGSRVLDTFPLLCLSQGGVAPSERSAGFHAHGGNLTGALLDRISIKADPYALQPRSVPLPPLLRRVLKAAGRPDAFADLGALEALRATYNVSDHAHPSPPIVPATSSDQQPLRGRGGGSTLRRYFLSCVFLCGLCVGLRGATDDHSPDAEDPFASPFLENESVDFSSVGGGPRSLCLEDHPDG